MNVKNNLRQEFTVNKNAAKGKYILKGRLTYLFCNEEEDWCNRFVQKFEFPFVVK